MPTIIYKGEKYAYLVQTNRVLGEKDKEKLAWLLESQETDSVSEKYIGPRRELITPWSTNASEIALNSGITGVERIEIFRQFSDDESFDPMTETLYESLTQESLIQSGKPAEDFYVSDIGKFNKEAGLALSDEEVEFLLHKRKELGRDYTDSELFAFAQINSEHCRHKIFNGKFIIDGKEKEKSLFQLIKDTSKANGKHLVSAYKDNVAFVDGPKAFRFAPEDPSCPSRFTIKEINTVLSLKAETHNFPTTVEPFNGASTGTGGEIRDRIAGGRGSIPLVGSAVYMTAHPRTAHSFGDTLLSIPPRKWKYQTPEQILIKASNGASDFGNKFGQPLIVGSVFTFEQNTSLAFYGYDRCIMLAGGVGFAEKRNAEKAHAKPGEKLVLFGGDNYRIGMAGGSVSSVDTGALAKEIELSAVQRSNPEMQKRAFNAIRALSELEQNPITTIHDHGAGGHVNCFSELLESGGKVSLDELPIGDKTLSSREILCNESQERMGLIVPHETLPLLRRVAERERAPLYSVGEVTGNSKIVFEWKNGKKPFELPVDLLFGSSPSTIMKDETLRVFSKPYHTDFKDGRGLLQALHDVFLLEGVACKDWLTNKVDRCVTGHIARQQCVGPLHLPLSNVGIAALDYVSERGIATSIGHASSVGIVDECAGAVLSVAEALTNLIWAPIEGGLESVALSANWMWPCKQPGEDTRLYNAVDALSKFCIALGIPVPTGKDSLSMTLKYGDGTDVRAPGTVIVSAAAPSVNFKKCITPDLKPLEGSRILYIDLSGMEDFPLGGSALCQKEGVVASGVPNVHDIPLFCAAFKGVQSLISDGVILAGHDVSYGGTLSCLCEMAFAGDCGITIILEGGSKEVGDFLFCEKPALLLQVSEDNISLVEKALKGVPIKEIGLVSRAKKIVLHHPSLSFAASLDEVRRQWFYPSFLLDSLQTRPDKANERFETLGDFPLSYKFPTNFTGRPSDHGIDLRRTKPTGIKAGIIREKGTNGDRELAFSMHAAGFDVVDITMSDLVSGREDLSSLRLIGFPGGFANSDVLGAGRGWAAAFKYDERAYEAIRKYMARPDTLSIGICNGCQLMTSLDLIYPEHPTKIKMRHNESQKFESIFVNVAIRDTKSVFLKPLVGSQLGIWISHGEGNFELPQGEGAYDIPARYISSSYPANPNGADFNAAAVSSADGRHLIIMPHLERSALPWQWSYYPRERFQGDSISPWLLAFAAAKEWCSQ